MTLNEGDRKWRSSSFNFPYFIPKVTGRSGYRSFLTSTCPFVTVRTAGSLAHVLAQHKMWNWYPWGVPVIGWEEWAHGTTPFSPVHRFLSEKRTGTGTWNHALRGQYWKTLHNFGLVLCFNNTISVFITWVSHVFDTSKVCVCEDISLFVMSLGIYVIQEPFIPR